MGTTPAMSPPDHQNNRPGADSHWIVTTSYTSTGKTKDARPKGVIAGIAEPMTMGCHLKDLYITIFSTIIIRLPKVAMYEVLVVTSYGYQFHSVGDNPFSTRILRVSSQNETGGYYPKPVLFQGNVSGGRATSRRCRTSLHAHLTFGIKIAIFCVRKDFEIGLKFLGGNLDFCLLWRFCTACFFEKASWFLGGLAETRPK